MTENHLLTLMDTQVCPALPQIFFYVNLKCLHPRFNQGFEQNLNIPSFPIYMIDCNFIFNFELEANRMASYIGCHRKSLASGIHSLDAGSPGLLFSAVSLAVKG